MLLKKQEKNNLVEVTYASSTICTSTYDKTTKDLIVVFKTGGQYKYKNVSETDYTRFELADSQGGVLNTHIKKYPFEKLDKVDTTSILKEITDLKDSERKAKLDYQKKLMVDKMQAIVTYYETTSDVDSSLYSKLKSSMEEYEKITSNASVSVVTD